VQIQPYLFYNGRCDEAIDFYRTALGAEVTMLVRFKDSPEPASHGAAEKVMHASLRIGDTTVLVSDGRCSGQLSFQGFALSLTVRDDAEAERLPPWALAVRCRCRWRRRSSARSSAWWPTVLASCG
jgi:PhnB protein